MQTTFLRPLVLAAVVALLAPSATATWYAFGTYEPDNAEDDRTFLWEDAPLANQTRVYFNAFTINEGIGNPNAGVLHTSNEAPTLEYHQAMLGIWVDCNGDGYVGHFESLMHEYPSQLLFDDTVCPLSEGAPNEWDGEHNYNGWVTELIPIAGITRDASDDDADLRIIRDPDAMVWGDYGRPDDSTAVSGGGTCAATPQPRGTYQSTGGFINFASCPTGIMARWNEVVLGRKIMGQDYQGLDSINGAFAQFAFGRTETGGYEARGHPIWDRPTFGSEDPSNSAVYVIDCGDDRAVHSGREYNSTGLNAVQPIPAQVSNMSVREVEPRPGSSSPTVAGTGNQLIEENPATGDCNHDNNAEGRFYGILEGDFNGVSRDRKNEADWNFQFTDRGRGNGCSYVILNLCGLQPVDNPLWPGSSGAPHPYYGITPLETAGTLCCFNSTSLWQSDSALIKRGPRTVVADTYEGTAAIAPAQYLSFYAFVGSTITGRTDLTIPSGRGEYGSGQCGDNTSGVHNGWECDKTRWYRNPPTVDNPDGTPMPEPYPYARPEQSYQFRDVDCHDGRNDLGVPLGLPAYGTGACSAYVSPPS